MTKILVTGGAGFIGSATRAQLQNHGHDIHVIDDLSFGHRDFCHFLIRIFISLIF